MNAIRKRVPTRFGPEIRFEITPIPEAPFRVALEHRFETLRHRLLLEWLEELAEPRFNSQVRRAANEAAALAWLTPYPLLVFPTLFEERAQEALVPVGTKDTGSLLNPELLPVC